MRGLKPATPGLVRVLDREGTERIYGAALTVLEQVGAVFDAEEALEVFRRHGLVVEGKRVHFRPSEVERALAACPSRVVLQARDPSNDVILGEGRVHYTNGFGAPWVKDFDTGEHRDATTKDLVDFVRMADYFDNVHYVLEPVMPQDVPVDDLDLALTYALLCNTEKHVHLVTETTKRIDEVIELGDIVSEEFGRPVYSLSTLPITPLHFPPDMALKCLKGTGRGIPFFPSTIPMAGGTSPATLAGTLVIQTCENIAGTVLRQLVDEGAPIVWSAVPSVMDMRLGKFVLGGPELALMCVATQQISDYLRIPYGYGTGGLCDSPISDVQAGFEKGMTILFAAMGGVEVIHHAVSGLLAGAMIASYEQMVVDNEVCNMVNRMVAGITVNEETLGVEVIKEVGPMGNFLDRDHTSEHFRREHYLTRLLCRASKADWEADGIKDIIQNARQRAQEILASHRPKPLSPETKRDMDRVLERFELSPSQLSP